MQEQALRSILLVRALESADPDGRLLPLADRVDATREALRAAGSPAAEAIDAACLGRVLAARAARLQRVLEPRHPAVARLGAGAPEGLPLAGLVLAGAFAAGATLATLDGSRQVDLLAFPLAGVVAWNLLVYLVLATGRLRGGHGDGAFGLAAGWAAFAERRLGRWLGRDAGGDAALARALEVFVRDWRAALGPWLLRHARRLLHLAAAAVAAGLVAGLYFRGITLEYRAAWESTFLGPDGVRAVLHALYGPASALTGIPLPADAVATESLRRLYGGVPAAPWLHLMAATVALWVIVPRLVLAVGSGLSAAWRLRRVGLPADVEAWGLGVLRAAGVPVGMLPVEALPYGRTLDEAGWRALAPHAARAFGAEGADVDLRRRPLLRYGEEAAFVDALGGRGAPAAERLLVVVDLAATPEDETHGRLLRALRDVLARRSSAARAVVVLDGANYARRMDPERVAARERAWTAFVAAQGLSAVRADLPTVAVVPLPDAAPGDRP